MPKNCYKRLVNSSGDIFCDTLQYRKECMLCITENTGTIGHTSVTCPKDRTKRFIGRMIVNHGSVYACGEGYGKKTLFIQDLDSLSASLTTLSKTKKEVEKYLNEESVTRIRRVLHNIRSINAHSLQEIRTLIPAYVIKHHKEKSISEFEYFIEHNIAQTASSLFGISKDLYEIKAEFSVYDKLVKGDIALSKRPYNIRDVIMTVLYPFFEDFKQKNVVVNVEKNYESVPVDFESFQVALYHIIENASKYVQNNSKANIIFKKEQDSQIIEFNMHSLFIDKDEEELIFQEGYSGRSAQKSKLRGEGIGMYRARKLIELNGGALIVKAGTIDSTQNGQEYALNTFVITLPLS